MSSLGLLNRISSPRSHNRTTAKTTEQDEVGSPNLKQPLSDVRIVDLTHYVAGPNCTRMLAAFGADVIKIERPDGGDPARRLGPFHRDHTHPEKSALFHHLNGNKKGVTLNLKSSKGVGIFKELVKDADILVESFRPGVMEKLGLSSEVLRDINPRLITTSISNFGQTGPYRDFKASELVLFGLGGPLQVTGLPERQPVKIGGRIVQYQAGVLAALLTMIAFYRPGANQRGGHIDVSIMESQSGTFDRWMPMLTAYAYTGHRFPRLPSAATWGGGIYPCRDGYVNILNPSNPARLNRLLDMIGRPDLKGDPRFSTLEQRFKPENMEVLQACFLEWVLSHNMDEILSESQSRKVMSGPIYTTAHLQEDIHFKFRRPWITVEHPYTGPVTHPGRPVVMSRTPWTITEPAPLLGQHNREIYCGRLGYSRKELARLRQLGVI